MSPFKTARGGVAAPGLVGEGPHMIGVIEMIGRVLLLVATFAAGQACAEGTRALVLDVLGDVAPPVELFQELEIGDRLTLGPAAEITLTHYAACEEVTLRGGTITIEDASMTAVGSALIGRVEADCPEMVSLTAADITNAAIITRAMSDKPLVPLRPNIAIAVPNAASYNELSVMGGDGAVATVAISGRRVAWPSGTAPLMDGGDYTIILRGPEAQQFAARVKADAMSLGLVVLRR